MPSHAPVLGDARRTPRFDALEVAVALRGRGPGRLAWESCSYKVARPGGYLARTHDPPPGNITMWREWARLAGVVPGAELAERRFG